MLVLAFAMLSCTNSVDDSLPSESKEETKPNPTPETIDVSEMPLTLEFTAEGSITITSTIKSNNTAPMQAKSMAKNLEALPFFFFFLC